MFNKLGSKTYRTFLAIGDFLSANSIVEEAVYRLVASKPQKRKVCGVISCYFVSLMGDVAMMNVFCRLIASACWCRQIKSAT